MYLFGREESEIEHYRSYKKKQRQSYFLIGGKQTLDFYFKKEYNENYFKINCKETKTIKDSDHLTVIGDIIIHSRVPELAMSKIEALYKKNSVANQEFIKELNSIVSSITRVSFKIERNQKKAARLKKIITRDFVIPQNIKKQLLF